MKQFLLFAAITLAASASAQKVSNKLVFQKGQKLEVITKINSLNSTEAMGQAMETKADMTITRFLDIEDVDKGTTTIEHKMKRMQMTMEMPMMGSRSFDSENEADMKGEGGAEMEKALKNKYKLKVGTDGIIRAVTADDDNPNKGGTTTEGQIMTGMFGSSANAIMGLPSTGSAFELSVLPNRTMNKGESWTDTSGGSTTNYTISEINGGNILVNFTSNGKTERKQETMGMEIIIATKDNTTGTMTIDQKTGMLKERTSTTVSEGTVNAGGQEYPTKATTKATITVTAK